ncbi:hypothetical protein JR316_0011838 [Psilocybe cubensis]|uniref:Uncharacterized protein n=1 Tax=Psilocybe cubensis TaxID=181762 RepID=A0ACB8GLJ3_PSICU|nr:hypothetical protein JR316_0011838 [Psilocybe cubensis]KAH9476267.1 hypothetical protein JR316_0011838 [Psilocybe cubensis]
MPLRLIDDEDRNGYRIEALAIVVSGIAYGIVLMLFFNTFWLVVRTKEQRMRTYMLAYTCVMVALSTGAMIQEVIYLMRDVLSTSAERGDAQSLMVVLASLKGIPLTLPFTMWGADGVLIWRCIILYRGISSTSKYILYGTLAIISLATIGGDIIILSPLHLGKISRGTGVSIIAMSTVLCNSVLSGLVALRIIHYDRALRQTGMANHESLNSNYNRIVTICVESSILIVLVGTIFISCPRQGIFFNQFG